MKKLITFVIVLVMLLICFAGCQNQPVNTPEMIKTSNYPVKELTKIGFYLTIYKVTIDSVDYIVADRDGMGVAIIKHSK